MNNVTVYTTPQIIAQYAAGTAAGIATVMWATKTGRKGRFFWFLGGYFAGALTAHIAITLYNEQ
jgi:hypothetical protein